MSRYAVVVEPLQAIRTDESPFGPHVRLLPGDEVKNVKLDEEGRYTFEVRRVGKSRVHFEWTLLHTAFDLPAFLDKGRAERASDRGVVRGRPPSQDKRRRYLMVRITDAEHAWLIARAKARGDITGAGTIARELMVEAGLLK